jgi:hypothetical protein
MKFCLFGFGGTRVGTQGFELAKQVLYCLRHTLTSLFSGYFGDTVLISTQGDLDLYPPNLHFLP